MRCFTVIAYMCVLITHCVMHILATKSNLLFMYDMQISDNDNIHETFWRHCDHAATN